MGRGGSENYRFVTSWYYEDFLSIFEHDKKGLESSSGQDEFCPRFQEVKKKFREEGEEEDKGKGIKTKFSHNIHQVNYDR